MPNSFFLFLFYLSYFTLSVHPCVFHPTTFTITTTTTTTVNASSKAVRSATKARQRHQGTRILARVWGNGRDQE
ncbi:hypothetical protein E2C01_085061 [Portunus trituberculatus]|uniref:Secreted protein n=1 Tax=Portunus trituberculatus TaxID=210409 RepID=A0A5B7JCJ6_PORTR|nr:hypothetical protein [Portunus trituberculatus]